MERKPIEAHAVKRGMHLLLKSRPCKIINVTTHKTGKHGKMKMTLEGLDLRNAKKVVLACPGHVTLISFEPIKKEYQLLHWDEKEKQLECLDAEGEQHVFPFDPTCAIGKEFVAAATSDTSKSWLVTLSRIPLSDQEEDEAEILTSYKEEEVM